MTLACGGRGPCCHVGYSHRHCEHCDVVIPTTVYPHYHGYPYPWTWSQGSYSGGLLGGQINSLTNQFQQLASGLNITEVPIDAGQQSSST